MDFLELNANVRTAVGKGAARTLRREGRMPAILYGPETEPVKLSINVKDMGNILKKSKSSQVLLNLMIQNGEETPRPAMMWELQTHPVSQNFIHADFYQFSTDKKIKVKVPVVTKGKAKGIELGGMLQVIRRELEVLCLPREIPESIEIDVTDLDMGESVHVEDIPLEGDIEIPTEVNFTVVTILSPKGTATDEEEAAEGEETEEATKSEA